MDHRYIDDHSVAQRFLDHTLTPAERACFEAHLVDCAECTDRVLLAEMFHSRNGHLALEKPNPAPVPKPATQGRLKYIVSLTPAQLFTVRFALAALAGGTIALLAWLLLTLR